MASRTYLVLVLGACAIVLAGVLALNLLLAYNDVRHDKNALASAWQQRTHGVTYAPPVSQNRPFKTLRLNDRLAEINAIVFGPSTAMGLRETALPAPVRAYNFTQTGNPLLAAISEAEYVVAHWSDRIRYLIIPLDWSLGLVYQTGSPAAIDLSPAAAAAAAAAAARVDWPAQVRDAVSLPRVRNLRSIIKEVFRAERRIAVFRRYFFEAAGEEYRCTDGALARDYETIFRGLCLGFRFDGSATLVDRTRIESRDAGVVLAAAVAPESRYAIALRHARGEPDAATLERLAVLSRRFARTGGTTVFFLPPLMPGLEQALLGSAHSGAALRRTKEALAAWSGREQLILLDAGAAEKFGCAAEEFSDPHHPHPACYAKVFQRLWGTVERGPRDGAS